jgi:hypothetical protein
MTECELLDKCGFFKKFMSSQEAACCGFISLYCRGSKMTDCQRKAYRKAHGSPPPDNMLPNGKMMVN